MDIRLEKPEEYRQVENLVREAFWNVYQPGCVEHYLLHKLRDDPRFVPELDYVVEEEGKVVAQIAYAKGIYRPDAGGEQELLLFGPVGVLPEYQNKGYGSALIRFTLNRARELGWPAVVITGNPAYYSRFGFEPAGKYGIHHAMVVPGRPPPSVPDPGAGSQPSAAFPGHLLGPSLLRALPGGRGSL